MKEMNTLTPEQGEVATIHCRENSNVIDHATMPNGPRLTAEQFAAFGEMWQSVGCSWQFDALTQRLVPCIELKKWLEMKNAEAEWKSKEEGA